MYYKLSLLVLVLIVSCALLTCALFKFDFAKIRKEELDQKIAMWIPFSLLFLMGLQGFATVIISIIFIGCSIEFYRQAQVSFIKKNLLIVYAVLFVGALLHLLKFNDVRIIIALFVATALSDVCGFLCGRFTKNSHYLPESINKNKTVEGLVGQALGALLGVILIKNFIINLPTITIFFPIGIGAIIGDLANSYVKRFYKITSWSRIIPGHGGFIDRFCSLAGSSCCLFYWLIFF